VKDGKYVFRMVVVVVGGIENVRSICIIEGYIGEGFITTATGMHEIQ
jgi:hypothetical protein